MEKKRMKTIKRILPIILAVVMIASAAVVFAVTSTADEIKTPANAVDLAKIGSENVTSNAKPYVLAGKIDNTKFRNFTGKKTYDLYLDNFSNEDATQIYVGEGTTLNIYLCDGTKNSFAGESFPAVGSYIEVAKGGTVNFYGNDGEFTVNNTITGGDALRGEGTANVYGGKVTFLSTTGTRNAQNAVTVANLGLYGGTTKAVGTMKNDRYQKGNNREWEWAYYQKGFGICVDETNLVIGGGTLTEDSVVMYEDKKTDYVGYINKYVSDPMTVHYAYAPKTDLVSVTEKIYGGKWADGTTADKTFKVFPNSKVVVAGFTPAVADVTDNKVTVNGTTKATNVTKFTTDKITAATTIVVNYKADYSAVAAAKAKIPADLTIYTDATVKDVNDAVAAVVEGKYADEQAIVDGYAAAIEEAIGNLEYKDADFTDLDAAIEDYEDNILPNLDKYKDTTDVEAAYDAADGYDRTGKNITDQDEIDGLADDLATAISELDPKDADFTELDAAIEDYEDNILPDLDKYKDTTDVEAAYDAADGYDREGKDIFDQDEIDGLADALATAISELDPKDADFTGLDAAIEDYEDNILPNLELYKDTTDVEAAYDAADGYNREGKNIFDQDEIDGLADDLATAISELDYKDADFTVLDANLRNAALFDESKYTEETYAVLDAAVKAANEYNREGKNITNQSEIDDLAAAINTAIEGLVAKPGDFDDLDSLLEAIAKLDEENFTEETWGNLEELLEDVEEIKKLDALHQDEIDEYVRQLTEAYNGLVYKPADYTELDKAIEEAEKLEESKYTEESFKALKEALAQGKNISRELDITKQPEIDEITKLIKDAMAALVEANPKTADYTVIAVVVAAIALVAAGVVLTKKVRV